MYPPVFFSIPVVPAIKTTSNELLTYARKPYDATYDKAVYMGYTLLFSDATNTGTILTQTVDTIRAKGELLANNVDIFAKTPEPQPQTVGNTALYRLSSQQSSHEAPMNTYVAHKKSTSPRDMLFSLIPDTIKWKILPDWDERTVQNAASGTVPVPRLPAAWYPAKSPGHRRGHRLPDRL